MVKRMLVERSITIKHIESHRSFLKFALVSSPTVFDSLHVLKIFQMEYGGHDEFCFLLLQLFSYQPEILLRRQVFLREIAFLYGNYPMDFGFDELMYQTNYFLDEVEAMLKIFCLYKGDSLPFNTVWLENPDTITFFKVEHSDL